MFDSKNMTPEFIKKMPKKTDFNQLLKVLNKEKADRPVLFEFFLNMPLYELLADEKALNTADEYRSFRVTMSAYKNAGYDYFTVHGSDFRFKRNIIHAAKSRSMNEGCMVTDLESYEKYEWVDPESFDYSRLKVMGNELPDGMKMIVFAPGGVLENVIEIVGYENLCYMIMDDPELAQKIFDDVGSRLLKYYQICGQFDNIGAMISNDDWGFNTQTMLSTEDMRKYVIPWHKKIADFIKSTGRPAIMHSCGKLDAVYEDIIDYIGYNGKHSYEDNIVPVEEMYERFVGRIAVLGGIDVDYVCRKPMEEVYKRSKAMLERTMERGGYALGTGNSIPSYVPNNQYFSMTYAALEQF